MAATKKKKAPAATGAITNRNTIHYQEEGASMLTTVAEPAEKFDTDIHVGNKTVFAADGSVWAHTELGALEFTPEQACAFAVALQAVAVHVMEQQPREIRRTTEPGAPAFEEAI